MPDAAFDKPVLIPAGEFLHIGAGVGVRRTICLPFQSDGGDRDHRKFGKPLFQIVVPWLALGETKPPAIVMNHDADMVRVVECRRGAVECGVVKVPFWRSKLPNELRELTPVFFVASAAPFRGEVILIP